MPGRKNKIIEFDRKKAMLNGPRQSSFGAEHMFNNLTAGDAVRTSKEKHLHTIEILKAFELPQTKELKKKSQYKSKPK